MKKIAMMIALFFASSCAHVERSMKFDFPEREPCRASMTKWGQAEARASQMTFFMNENVTDSPDVLFCLSFLDDHKKTLDEAKAFVRGFFARYVAFLETDPAVLAYCQSLNTFNSAWFPSTKPREGMIAFKIAYWDKEMNRYPSPYISEVVFAERTFFYYDADPATGELHLVLKERYKDLFKKKA